MPPEKDLVAGIDAGSTAIKITLYDGERLLSRIAPAGWNPREAAAAALDQAARDWRTEVAGIAAVYGTGYGRATLGSAARTVTEITCHAKGAAFLQPSGSTVIDIGGQDVKAIRLEAAGQVGDFVMNDKCAAGTGRFLQVMAGALGLDVAAMAALGPAAGEACRINAMCTVFAESEVIGLLNRGVPRENIIAGLYKSIASRVATMAARITPGAPVVLTGGGAFHRQLCAALEEELKMPVIVPGEAVFAGSIGAALIAWEDIRKGG